MTTSRERQRKRLRFLTSAAALLGASAACLSSAQAQTTAPRAQTENIGALEEIIVTARKREERLRDIPVAVTSLSAQQLEANNIVDNSDLLGRVPNVYLTGAYSVNTELRLTMRGVGVNSPLDPSVAIFVDGVYMPTVGWNMDFLEAERVEVLRGPQGAVFGRNTQAGAISIITKEPSQEFGGRVRLEGDDFDTYRANLYLTGPLGDTAAFSIAGLAEDTNGFLRNVTRNRDELARDKRGARVALSFQPSDRLSVKLAADGITERGGFYPSGEPVATQANFTGQWEVPTDQSSHEKLDNWGGSLTIAYAMESATLTSISGYRHTKSLALSDLDFINTPNRDGQPPQNIPRSVLGDGFPAVSGNYLVIGREQSLASEELRLSSNGSGPLKWLVGAYAYSEDNDRNREQRAPDSFLFPNPGNFVSDATQQQRDGYAAFGQLTYTVGEQLDLTLGGRYTYDDDEQDLRIAYNIGGGILQANFTDHPTKSFSDFTPEGSIAYRWTPDFMTYATVAKGFKSGGFNLQGPPAPSGNAGFDSESSIMYEIGAKLAAFEQRLTLDLAVFQIDTDDMQVNQTIAIAPGVLANLTTNAGEARSRGAELEVAANPIRGLVLTTAVGYTDAEYVKYVVSPVLNLSGQPIQQVPEWTANFGAEYSVRLTDTLDLVMGGSWRYIGDQLLPSAVPNVPSQPLAGYDTTSLRLGLESERWDATLYCDNVFDDYNIVYRSVGATFYTTPGTTSIVQAAPPRRIGIKASYKF